MNEKDFEGTLVLEQLAAIGRVEDFFDAVDSDDVDRASSLMKKANLEASTIAMVVRKMEEADGEHWRDGDPAAARPSRLAAKWPLRGEQRPDILVAVRRRAPR
jgi:hypothetical protein